MSRRDVIAFAVFGTWSIVGLFVDGWAHVHQRPETFFTPWHAILYSGVGAAVAWSVVDGRRQQRSGLAAATPGGPLTVVGLGIFLLGGLGDFAWHTAFGIEKNLAALLSPTHLMLMTGGLLLVTGPLRAAWARPGHRSLPSGDLLAVLSSAALFTALASFFLQWISPFRANPDAVVRMGGSFGRYVAEQAQITTVASVLVANALMVGVLLYVIRRWQPPPGTFTVFFTVVALAMSGLDSFRLLPLVVGAPVGGIVADWLVARMRPSPHRRRAVRLVAALTPLALWLPYFAVLKLGYSLDWKIHLWAGAIFLAVLTGIALSVLAFPPPVPVLDDPVG